MLLKDKTVIVTGGSRGIGAAVAIGCAQHGANVVVSHHSNADEVVAAIQALGRGVVAVKGDVADPATGSLLVQAAVENFGGVDVLVSNAGICPFHAFLDMPPETLKRTMEVNLHGAYFVTQAVANRMKEQGRGGSIIAMSSISAWWAASSRRTTRPPKRRAFADAIVCDCAGQIRHPLQFITARHHPYRHQ